MLQRFQVYTHAGADSLTIPAAVPYLHEAAQVGVGSSGSRLLIAGNNALLLRLAKNHSVVFPQQLQVASKDCARLAP